MEQPIITDGNQIKQTMRIDFINLPNLVKTLKIYLIHFPEISNHSNDLNYWKIIKLLCIFLFLMKRACNRNGSKHGMKLAQEIRMRMLLIRNDGKKFLKNEDLGPY
jgi:hypothetical protein